VTSRNLKSMQKNSVPFLDVRWTYSTLKDEIDLAIAKVLTSGNFILGEDCELFEQEFARFVGAKYCVGVANGLDAVFLSLKAAGVDEESEVIVPAHTFVATWLAVSMCGAKIVPVDISPITYNLIPEEVAKKVTKRTKAIIPVHLYGLPSDLVKFQELSKNLGIPLVEDAAQAHGAHINGKKIGSSDGLVAWSFYPGKNLGAFGDAGAVTTDNKELADSLRTLRNYGGQFKYVHDQKGFNSRLDEIQAAILRVKLRHLDEWNLARSKIAEIYSNELSGLPMILPTQPNGYGHVWHLYVIQVVNRDDVKTELIKLGIEAGIHYPTPIFHQNAYRSEFINFHSETAERVAKTCLSLPIGPHMTERDAHIVCDGLKQIFRKTNR